MTTKLNKSKIQISGELRIDLPINQSLCDLPLTSAKFITLTSLKQSKSGVYEILNKFNGKRYIGMTVDLERRMKRHKLDLWKGIHKSNEMQTDYFAHCRPYDVPPYSELDGVFNEVFEFNVIIYCYPSQLTFWESILIDALKPEYNTKKKKQIPPKKFDINGNKIVEENKLDFYFNTGCTSLDDNDDLIEEEMM